MVGFSKSIQLLAKAKSFKNKSKIQKTFEKNVEPSKRKRKIASKNNKTSKKVSRDRI